MIQNLTPHPRRLAYWSVQAGAGRAAVDKADACGRAARHVPGSASPYRSTASEVMSRRSLPRARSVRRPPVRDPTSPTTDLDAIALRIYQIAATAGILAVVAGRMDEDGPALSHALYLIEETLLEVEERVERLRQGPPGRHPTAPS